jgi:DNA-binding Lrp family transcriptional regulator
LVLAFVLGIVEPGKETDVVLKLRRSEKVSDAHVVYGAYDIHITLEIEDLNELSHLNQEIRNIEGVTATKTLIATIF